MGDGQVRPKVYKDQEGYFSIPFCQDGKDMVAGRIPAGNQCCNSTGCSCHSDAGGPFVEATRQETDNMWAAINSMAEEHWAAIRGNW